MDGKKVVWILCVLLVLTPFISAKNFNITSNGDSLFFVNGSSGRVGIGTATPESALTVKDGDFRVVNGRWFLREDDGGANAVVFDADNTGGELNIYESGVIKSFITGSGDSYFNGGNVGIGTSSPNSTLDVNGNISVNSSILSPTGTLTLGGIGGTNNEDLTLDFEGNSNQVTLSSNTGLSSFSFGNILAKFNDNAEVRWGGNNDIRMLWQTTGNDNFQIGTQVGSAAYSGYISIMENADMGNANRSPTSTSADPVFRVYSSDATQANDYIEMYHDQGNGELKIGNGNLDLSIATGAVRFQYGSITGLIINSDPVFDQELFAINDAVGNQIVIINANNNAKDHDHPFQTNPTLYIHSDTNPDTDNSQWVSLTHDKTDAFIGVGNGSLKVNGSIIPGINTTYDLGTANLAWDNVYAVTYYDLTPAWENESDGSALEAVAEIKNIDGELDHESYPVKLRSKHYVVEKEEKRSKRVKVGVDEDNESVYREEEYKVKVKESVEVDEGLSESEQEAFVAEELDVSRTEVGKAEVLWTRDIGGTLTMVIESVKELFGKVGEQDERISMLEEELCKKDGSYSWCKGLGVESVLLEEEVVVNESVNETVKGKKPKKKDSLEDVVGVGNESVEEGNESEVDDVEAPSVPLEGKAEDEEKEKKEDKEKKDKGAEEDEVDVGITGKIVRNVGDAGLEIREWFVSGFEKVVDGVRGWFG